MTTAVEAQPEKTRHPAYRVWTDVTEEVRKERIQNALQRVLNDERTEDIAKDLGISRSALNMAFLAYAEDDWKQAQVARAISRLERVKDNRQNLEQRIEACDTREETARLTLILAHARDEEKSAQWELERLCRRIYGTDQPPDQASRVSITLNLASSGAQNAVIEGQVVPE